MLRVGFSVWMLGYQALPWALHPPSFSPLTHFVPTNEKLRGDTGVAFSQPGPWLI